MENFVLVIQDEFLTHAQGARAHGFNDEDYYIEDVTSVMADYQALILKIIEARAGGFNNMIF